MFFRAGRHVCATYDEWQAALFALGDSVIVVRSVGQGARLLGKRGRVVGTASSGQLLVRFGRFWNARVETCFPDELAIFDGELAKRTRIKASQV
ncbi:MAG: hypothetical protein U0174_27075 [Polyangiaceae bacterium]